MRRPSCETTAHRSQRPSFHPNAKVGIARSSKKLAVAKPKRNVGNFDDERCQLDIVDGSDEEEDASDAEDQEVCGVELLNWSRDPYAHGLVQPGQGNVFL